MLSYIARRLLIAVITFLGITVATFVLIHSVPGDPILFYIGKLNPGSMSQEALDVIRRDFHLDRPLPIQYAYWLRGIVTLDLGDSIIERRPVTAKIGEKLPATIVLNFVALLVAALIGIPVGLWSATRSGRTIERATSIGFFLLYSLPSFWIALLLMRWFAVRWQVLPLLGMTSDGYDYLPFGAQIVDRMRHLVLPVTTLAITQIAIFARFSKSAITEVIGQDFITTARAKGVGDTKVLWHHAFRNALIPMITLLGLTIPSLLSGSVVVEQIFQWDGIGRLYFDAILTRDYPLVMALTVATAVVTLLASLLADIVYTLADPRIRLEADS